MSQASSQPFSAYQKRVLLLLAFIQFSIILDFMIISPIGDILMKTLSIGTTEFGLVVSAYAFSAAIAGIVAAGFMDKFDRKKLLVWFFSGFIIGTLACALSHNYVQLMLARIVTGIFAGVSSAALFTLVIDIFAPQQRGRAMGVVQMGFGVSQVVGIPLSIYIATHLGWESSFIAIVILALGILLAIGLILQPVTAHLSQQHDKNPFAHFLKVLSNTDYQKGFAAVMFLAIGGFMIMPFTAPFLINNVQVTAAQLPLIYLSTGLLSLVMMPLMGKFSDSYDRFKLFTIGSIGAVIMVFVYTNLSVTPLWLVIVVNVLLFVCILSRMTPAMALNSMVAKPEDRGAYM
jgi:predicted MFS family arabinose efflux permease